MLNKRNKSKKPVKGKRLDWIGFEKWVKAKKFFFFTTYDLMRVFGASRTSATFFLYRHARGGELVRLKPGFYILAEKPPPDFLVANKLYEPSYISLETALSFHALIPETVYQLTSVTTRKTKSFEVLGKVFSYRHIKREAFTGYAPIPYLGVTVFIADPEKAFVDYLYLALLSGRAPSDLIEGVFERLKFERLDKAKALSYAQLFGNRPLILFIKENLK